MFSFFGWTPSLRRMLRSELLTCGCSVGVYETFSGEAVRVIDARAASCHDEAHLVDAVLRRERALGGSEPQAGEPSHRSAG